MSSRRANTERRVTRRQWSRRWTVLRRLFITVIVASACGGAGWLLFFSSVLAVERVTVDGARLAGAEEVAAAAAVPLGQPLARVDADAAARRVEERVREVESADVSRAWPHEVSVVVTERTPVAVVDTAGRLAMVDANGVVFRDVRRAPVGLPVVQSSGAASTAAVREAAAVLAALPTEILEPVRRVEADTVDSITLLLSGGRRVAWGSAADSEQKASVLAVLLQRDAAVYDVTVPGLPTTAG